MGIGDIRLPKFGTHPLLLCSELGPEHDEYQDETDDPAHLRESNPGAKKPGQNAGVNGVTDQSIGPGGDQLVALLNSDCAAPVAREVLARPNGEEKAHDGNSSSNPKWPEARPPELAVEPGQRDASCRKEDDHNQEDEGPHDAQGGRLAAPGGFAAGSLDSPIDKKADPYHGKERFIEPEHSGPPGAVVVYNVFAVFTWGGAAPSNWRSCCCCGCPSFAHAGKSLS